MANILFIDDEDNARIGLTALLRHDGHHVDAAVDCDEAIAFLCKQKYDLVVLDVRLPPGLALVGVPFREAGKELLIRLRSGAISNAKTPSDVPVVALTVVSDVDVMETVKGRATATENKPMNPEETFAEIRAILKRVQSQ